MLYILEPQLRRERVVQPKWVLFLAPLDGGQNGITIQCKLLSNA